MPVFWLSDEEINFPHPREANPDGLLAVGGDLSDERLLLAYSWGIFPWYSEGDPLLWWHPDPRFVLFPEKLKVAKSMRPYFNQPKFQLTFDTAFREVMTACGEVPRAGQFGTWIMPEMLDAYERLHEAGYAHSVEVWQDGQLVGGLYGIALGQVFFGESMFTKVSNASKFGFISMVKWLQARGFRLIDCQMRTPHLASLGAEPISRSRFLGLLAKNREVGGNVGKWRI